MSFADILELEFRAANLNVSPAAQQQLALYAAEIEHWNRAVNLTALRGAALVRRLIVEPIRIGEHLQMSGVLADVGSGNGSPGIPLCIGRNFSAAHLIEPRVKRAVFLRHAIAKLRLKDVVVENSRIEELPVGRLSSDWITLQAIDPTPALLDALRKIGHNTTSVVWITSIETPPVKAAEKVEIPSSPIKFWIFRLDQI